MLKLFVSCPRLSPQQTNIFTQRFGTPAIHEQDTLVWSLPLDQTPVLQAEINALAIDAKVDFAIVPHQRRLGDFKLAAFDMDSTLITIECIDEIADFIGKKSEVSAITEAAMRGEISDYKESLSRRVALLKGLPETALGRVYDERLRLTPGAQALVDFFQANKIKILLVSGGFTFFTERLKGRLNLDFAKSNQLEIVDGILTGSLVGGIVDAKIKRDTVLETCIQIGCDPSEVIAIGDGANDLQMMAVAGLSVAYKAKPVVQLQATHAINYGGLNALIPWLPVSSY
jgi:phosphoserine phosphatase